jgi:glycosyltransferase involved in cell wall biosynthesis
MAIVPDDFLVGVYKECGVKIPIFVLPLPLKLQDFLNFKQQTTPHKKFVFGMSGAFWLRKNHLKILEAFAAEFGNRKDVKLKLHGRFGEENIIQELAKRIRELNLTNVELIVKPYNNAEYLSFFKSLDCYVFLSMGEGFSITPREALAAGKPCIVTKNTAQITICNSGAVRIVPSNVPVPAIYDCYAAEANITDYGLNYIQKFFKTTQEETINKINASLSEDEIEKLWKAVSIGYQFDCLTKDAREAMRDVYEHYNHYVNLAKQGKNWVKNYLAENLSAKYFSLIKPKVIYLGKENMINEDFLITNSKALYEKYKLILS